MHDKLMETCVRKFEREAARRVKRVFEAKRGLPGYEHDVPWIGGTYFARAPRNQHVGLMRRVRQALVAQQWFERTAPKWAHPLPLRESECMMLRQDADSRNRLLAHYAWQLREQDWVYCLFPAFDAAFVQRYADNPGAAAECLGALPPSDGLLEHAAARA
jgi:hypothetical protein